MLAKPFTNRGCPVAAHRHVDTGPARARHGRQRTRCRRPERPAGAPARRGARRAAILAIEFQKIEDHQHGPASAIAGPEGVKVVASIRKLRTRNRARRSRRGDSGALRRSVKADRSRRARCGCIGARPALSDGPAANTGRVRTMGRLANWHAESRQLPRRRAGSAALRKRPGTRSPAASTTREWM